MIILMVSINEQKRKKNGLKLGNIIGLFSPSNKNKIQHLFCFVAYIK